MLGVEVFIRGASAWDTGCSSGSLGLLISAVAGQSSANVCGWVVV
jgi:hypothetical protein